MSGPAVLDAVGQTLVARYGTRDPEALAAALGVHIYEADLGRLKGMYRVILRRRCIFVSTALDPDLRRTVLAHELGHDRLHRAYASGTALGELELFDMTSRREYEANLVAAGILLSDDDVLEGIYCEGRDAASLARELRVDVNLLALKIEALRDKGHPLIAPDRDSRFLRG